LHYREAQTHLRHIFSYGDTKVYSTTIFNVTVRRPSLFIAHKVKVFETTFGRRNLVGAYPRRVSSLMTFGVFFLGSERMIFGIFGALFCIRRRMAVGFYTKCGSG
jgi:hypothetical protein